MNIVCLLGSPRKKGNSAIIANSFIEEAKKHGANVTTHYLNGLEYKGCQGCFVCKNRLERCVLEDGLTQVLEDVRECDALVMATPVYYGEVTSQLKGFIDRSFSYLVPNYGRARVKTRLEPGKKLVMCIAQGHPRENYFDDIFPRYARFFKWMGFDDAWLVRGCGIYDMGAAREREDVLEGARCAARQLMGLEEREEGPEKSGEG